MMRVPGAGPGAGNHGQPAGQRVFRSGFAAADAGGISVRLVTECDRDSSDGRSGQPRRLAGELPDPGAETAGSVAGGVNDRSIFDRSFLCAETL